MLNPENNNELDIIEIYKQDAQAAALFPPKSHFEGMVHAHTGLVVKIAAKYIDSPLPFPDRIQAGNLGLMRAVEQYDENIGAFSTYATPKIKQSINRAVIDQRNGIRIPTNLYQKISRILNFQYEFYQNYQQFPDYETTGATLNIPPKKVKEALEFYDRIQVTYLDAPLDEDDEDSPNFADLIFDSLDIQHEVESNRSTREFLQAQINTLPTQEAVVIHLFFWEGLTHAEISEYLRIPETTVRNTKTQALRHLQKYFIRNKLKTQLLEK